MTDSPSCCVDGCAKVGTHKRRFTIANDAWGDTTVDAFFCCEHIDRLSSEDAPFLDLKVTGEMRDDPPLVGDP